MDTNKARSLNFPLSAAALAVAFVVSAATVSAADNPVSAEPSSNAQQIRLNDDETVAQYSGWDDPDMSRIAVHGGRALMRQVQAANADLAQNKIGAARRALDAADGFAQGLQLMIPYTVVVDDIRNVKHELLVSSADVAVNDLLPIHASLNEMAEFAPRLAGNAKSRVDEAVVQARNGDKKQAAKTLEEVAAEISATTVYLPVLYVERQLNAALNALDQDPPDVKMAQSAVDNTLLSLQHSRVNMYIFPDEEAAGKTTQGT